MRTIFFCLTISSFLSLGCTRNESFTEEETARLKAIASAVDNAEQAASEILAEANKKTAKTQVTSMSNMVNNYLLMVGSYPNSLDDLHVQPSGMSNSEDWVQVSATPIPNDPWGNPFVYSKSSKEFSLSSNGPDGKPNTEDDIVPKRNE